LILITVTYFVVYFNYPATPGNNPDYPLGWWGWFDQGQYQLSADALSKWDLSREKHFYPPLYPAIGAALIKLSAGHVYWSVNLICLLWFSYVFIRLSDNYVRRWVGVFLLFSSVIFNRIIFENFIIPWTSTLSAALIATGILGLVWFNELKSSSTKKISGWQVIVLSTSLGLLAAVRPIDAVAVGVVIAVALIIIYWQFRTEDADRVPSISRVLILVTLGASIGPIIFLVFNYGVYGELMGRYFNVANSNGYYFSDLPEKFVSIWLDSKSLYREENAA